MLLASVLACGALVAQLHPTAPDSFWIDGAKYRLAGMPTELTGVDPTNGIYVFDGLEGQMAVAEAKPGDADYYNGRWQVGVLEFTESGIDELDSDGDGTIDSPLTSWEEVEDHINQGHLVKTDVGPAFVCSIVEQG
jgi:hypothetical protein